MRRASIFVALLGVLTAVYFAFRPADLPSVLPPADVVSATGSTGSSSGAQAAASAAPAGPPSRDELRSQTHQPHPDAKTPEPAADYLGTVNSALASTVPSAWVKAADILNRCEQAAAHLDYLNAQKGKRPAAVLAELITQAEQEARQCQALSAEQMKQRDELLRRALGAKEPGAAMLFMESHKDGRSLSAQDRAVLYEAMRADARRADKDLLAHLVAFGSLYGLEDYQRRAYQILLIGLGESRQRDFASKYINTVPGMGLRISADAEAKAQAMAKDIAGR